jgi:thiol-disulfide isomerase/thioredoxin
MKVTPLRIVIAAVVAGVLGVVASVLVNGPGPLFGTELGQRVLNGAMRATLEVEPLDGGSLRLPETYAGQPVLVNLWASWCGPCIEEMPELDRYAREQGEHGVQVLGIALDDREAVEDFLQRIPVAYAIALDAPGPADAGVKLGNPRGVLPYTALVSADGRLLKQKIGPFQHGEIDGWAHP